MSKNLGYIELNDDKALIKIVSEQTDIDPNYFDTNATWMLAEQSMDELGQETTEVRIDGLNYVIIERRRKETKDE